MTPLGEPAKEEKTTQRHARLPVRNCIGENGKVPIPTYPERRRKMPEKMLMRVEEVAEALDVSKPYAYKLMQQLNKELKEKGFITITGRIDRRYFQERFYGSHSTDQE